MLNLRIRNPSQTHCFSSLLHQNQWTFIICFNLHSRMWYFVFALTNLYDYFGSTMINMQEKDLANKIYARKSIKYLSSEDVLYASY